MTASTWALFSAFFHFFVMKYCLALTLLAFSWVAEANTINFDSSTMSMTLPSVNVQGKEFELKLRYDPDGRFSLVSARAIEQAPVANTCNISYGDSRGVMNLFVSRVVRQDPADVDAYNNAFDKTTAVVPPSKNYFRLVVRAVSGAPFFCSVQLDGAQGQRKFNTGDFFFLSDRYGSESGQASCGTFDAGQQSVLYLDATNLAYQVPGFSFNAPVTITFNETTVSPSRPSCTF